MHPTTTLVCSHESCEKTITLDVADQIPSMWWCPKHREKNLMPDQEDRIEALAREAAFKIYQDQHEAFGEDYADCLIKWGDGIIADAIRTALAEAEDATEIRSDTDRIDQIENYGFRVECEGRFREDGSVYSLWRPRDFEHADDPEWESLRDALDATVPTAVKPSRYDKKVVTPPEETG